MKNIAVILAGGKGSRMGVDIPKQFIPLADGRTVLETCVTAFEQNEHIDEIAIVMLEDHIAQAQAILPADRFPKVHHWIPGGKERWESSLNAIMDISKTIQSPADSNLLIHDCARPFISQDLITRVCEALKHHQAVSVAVAVTDTVYCVKPDGLLEDIPPRAYLRRAQTPQAFRLSLLLDAYASPAFNEYIKSSALAPTDDVSVVFRTIANQDIFILPGEEGNRKITFAEDINPKN